MPPPVRRYVITPHAAFEFSRRRLPERIVRDVLAAPEQRHSVRPGRDVLQCKVEFENRTYLVRVFVDVDRNPAEVVTAYRTSQITKYWREPS